MSNGDAAAENAASRWVDFAGSGFLCGANHTGAVQSHGSWTAPLLQI
ncbi:MAG: hypothetical protein ACOY90_13240 [Candidatus Zhuqueibacterota bacterium]